MRLKQPGKVRQRGQAATVSTIEKTNGSTKGQRKVISSKARVLGDADGPAQTGLNIGLTIPGPKKSFMMARVDVWVTLPCANDVKSICSAQAECSDLAQGFLESEAKEIQEYFRLL